MVGFATAYPFNLWLVKRKLKHGLMTERRPGSIFDVKPLSPWRSIATTNKKGATAAIPWEAMRRCRNSQPSQQSRFYCCAPE
jgi:hypothetical protein